ncbi:hypothetical protein OGR47_04515 [Methylocystis sp. MJC1]|jgi:beta-phosphoglucomutase-like phosphatase (HAD superfamily)|uniref:hypothetical protein n=1 Tax=Methylocystis sp. MJC1 TaxID=2654282 RepID=UPI0013EBC93D|nr:hypothetical protein [Methylocystis sp. MJC1]KAF2991182.1 hypothetical protein MJC1_01531 [Methylocystis sp. MJC1]MBU6526272.1 hypothetical protein [Methylocystis sp. MJC1]UZX12727.1 hypothetical protein OGR47_04515 [Methylocystis sp. MJC1]
MDQPDETPSPEIAERAFLDAWEHAVKIDGLEDELKAERHEKRRKEILREIRSLENKITPTAKRAAADRNRPLVRAMTEYLQKSGVPSNIAHLLDWLRGQGFVIAQDKEPKPAGGVTARTARYILMETFDIHGEKGRKPTIR